MSTADYAERQEWASPGGQHPRPALGIVRRSAKTAKLNDVDPQAWLADVLRRISDLPVSKLPELLPWNWGKKPAQDLSQAA